jgi:DNA-binding LytR/AlgR family response regulator
MSLKCIVVDDEKGARDILKTYIADVIYLDLIGEFKNALEALDFLRENKSVDVVFLDINMPKLSGIDAAKMFLNTNIIFTTAHREFAIQGFELNATDYLLKPFSFDRFLSAVQRISFQHDVKKSSEKKNSYIDLKVGKIMTRIEFSDLIYIEGLSNYVKIITEKESLVCYYKISDLVDQLPKQFIRVHKSYIINLSKITSYTKEYVLIDSKYIPIGKTFKSMVLKQLIK